MRFYVLISISVRLNWFVESSEMQQFYTELTKIRTLQKLLNVIFSKKYVVYTKSIYFYKNYGFYENAITKA